VNSNVKRMVVEALVPGCTIIGIRIVNGASGIEMRPALTFHCREIPSGLVVQKGDRQVDEMGGVKGEGLGGRNQ